MHLLCCSKAAAWRALRTAANPQKRRCHCTFSSTSFRYEPTAQDSSFLSNDERVMFADPTTVTASPRVEATLEKKEHSRISAEPPSLKAPPTSGKTGRVVISGRLMHKYGRHHHQNIDSSLQKQKKIGLHRHTSSSKVQTKPRPPRKIGYRLPSPAELPSKSQRLNSCWPVKVSTAPPVSPATFSKKWHLENTRGLPSSPIP